MTLPIPDGFQFAGVHCGLKRKASKEDLTLVVCPRGAVTAGVYTTNLVCAAPVLLDRTRTPSRDIRVVVVNSGNANACTGEQGDRDAAEMTRLAALACGAEPEQALVMSTGVIGEPLPMEKIAAGISDAASKLGADEKNLMAAARGILTTDKGVKVVARELTLSCGPVQITAFAKGAGMIGPKMATMLGLILTDAPITPTVAQTTLAHAVDESFHCISVEGHTSTNDTVLLLASGNAGAATAAGGAQPTPISGEDLATFEEAVTEVCIELARMIPADGEGASHLITLDVKGCASRQEAFQVAKAIADSPLVKTAIAGNDPNWGRIVSAAGYAEASFDPAEVDLYINNYLLYKQGSPVSFNAVEVSNSIRENDETHIELTLGNGPGQVRFYTSDLTLAYVKFNSAYHS